MKKTHESKPAFVVCINNEDYPASLELHKIYCVVPDKNATADEDIRVMPPAKRNKEEYRTKHNHTTKK